MLNTWTKCVKPKMPQKSSTLEQISRPFVKLAHLFRDNFVTLKSTSSSAVRSTYTAPEERGSESSTHRMAQNCLHLQFPGPQYPLVSKDIRRSHDTYVHTYIYIQAKGSHSIINYLIRFIFIHINNNTTWRISYLAIKNQGKSENRHVFWHATFSILSILWSQLYLSINRPLFWHIA